MTARALVEQAIRAVCAAPATIALEDILPQDPRARLAIVEEIERLRDGRVTTRLGDAHHVRTVGDLVEAVERAYTAGACGLCREPLGASGCRYCPRQAA